MLAVACRSSKTNMPVWASKPDLGNPTTGAAPSGAAFCVSGQGPDAHFCPFHIFATDAMQCAQDTAYALGKARRSTYPCKKLAPLARNTATKATPRLRTVNGAYYCSW